MRATGVLIASLYGIFSVTALKDEGEHQAPSNAEYIHVDKCKFLDQVSAGHDEIWVLTCVY